jgi:hypothetical protein
MRIGELLLAEKLITPEGLEEALEEQVIHGGRLGTMLLELGFVQEKDLARCLGKQHGTAFACGEMQPDPRALELVDQQFMDDKDVLPMRVDPTRVSVAVINPHDHETLQAIAFKTGKRVVPVVIPEFRMHQMLRRYCKAFRDMRPIDMGQTRPSKLKGTLKEGPTPMAAAELINEEEFQKLYAQALEGGTAAPAPQAASEAEEPLLEGIVIEEAPEPPAPPPAAAPPPPPAPIPAPAPVPAAAAAPPKPPAPPPPEPPATPLTFAEAQQQLSSVSDREDVARTVLRFAVGKWKRALLLSVQGDLVTGWHGVGQNIKRKAVQRIGISLRGQNTFKLVRDTRSHYIGPVKRDAGAAIFYKLLAGGPPSTAVMLPLLVRGRVVHILYVDNGPDQVTPPDIGELLILAQSVGRSYEAMIRRRKAN